MKNRKLAILLCALLLTGVSVGCTKLSMQESVDDTANKAAVKLYDEFTDIKLFQGVPAMSVKNGRTDIKGDLGGANQVILVNGSTADE